MFSGTIIIIQMYLSMRPKTVVSKELLRSTVFLKRMPRNLCLMLTGPGKIIINIIPVENGGNLQNYHLAINTGYISLDNAVELILDFVDKRNYK